MEKLGVAPPRMQCEYYILHTATTSHTCTRQSKPPQLHVCQCVHVQIMRSQVRILSFVATALQKLPYVTDPLLNSQL
jgi:hypothetical protein